MNHNGINHNAKKEEMHGIVDYPLALKLMVKEIGLNYASSILTVSKAKIKKAIESGSMGDINLKLVIEYFNILTNYVLPYIGDPKTSRLVHVSPDHYDEVQDGS